MKWLYASLGWIAFGFAVSWIVRRLVGRPDSQAPTYRIAADGKSITCLRCGLTSWHSEDVRQVYCGNCHIFHVR
jgi:hypothetical protein